jgi:hypothetical protein
MLLADFSDERCITERDGMWRENHDKNKLKIEYLKRENQDLQMDLDDLHINLQINKSIMSNAFNHL